MAIRSTVADSIATGLSSFLSAPQNRADTESRLLANRQLEQQNQLAYYQQLVGDVEASGNYRVSPSSEKGAIQSFDFTRLNADRPDLAVQVLNADPRFNTGVDEKGNKFTAQVSRVVRNDDGSYSAIVTRPDGKQVPITQNRTAQGDDVVAKFSAEDFNKLGSSALNQIAFRGGANNSATFFRDTNALTRAATQGQVLDAAADTPLVDNPADAARFYQLVSTADDETLDEMATDLGIDVDAIKALAKEEFEAAKAASPTQEGAQEDTQPPQQAPSLRMSPEELALQQQDVAAQQQALFAGNQQAVGEGLGGIIAGQTDRAMQYKDPEAFNYVEADTGLAPYDASNYQRPVDVSTYTENPLGSAGARPPPPPQDRSLRGMLSRGLDSAGQTISRGLDSAEQAYRDSDMGRTLASAGQRAVEFAEDTVALAAPTTPLGRRHNAIAKNVAAGTADPQSLENVRGQMRTELEELKLSLAIGDFDGDEEASVLRNTINEYEAYLEQPADESAPLEQPAGESAPLESNMPPTAAPLQTREQVLEAIQQATENPTQEQTDTMARYLQSKGVSEPKDLASIPVADANAAIWLMASRQPGNVSDKLAVAAELFNFVQTGNPKTTADTRANTMLRRAEFERGLRSDDKGVLDPVFKSLNTIRKNVSDENGKLISPSQEATAELQDMFTQLPSRERQLTNAQDVNQLKKTAMDALVLHLAATIAGATPGLFDISGQIDNLFNPDMSLRVGDYTGNIRVGKKDGRETIFFRNPNGGQYDIGVGVGLLRRNYDNNAVNEILRLARGYSKAEANQRGK